MARPAENSKFAISPAMAPGRASAWLAIAERPGLDPAGLRQLSWGWVDLLGLVLVHYGVLLLVQGGEFGVLGGGCG